MSTPILTIEERRAAVLARRAALEAELATAYAEQEVADLEATADLEAEYGTGRIVRVAIRCWKPGVGAATCLVARVPEKRESFFRRFEQQLVKSKPESTARLDAMTTLAEACIVYPQRGGEMYNATVELADGVLSNIAKQITDLVQGKAEAEGKD